MTALSFMDRQHNLFSARVEFVDKLRDKKAGYQRMIDGAENNSLGFAKWKTSDRCLNGRKLSLPPIRIWENPCRMEPKLGANFFGLSAEDNAGDADAFVPGC